MAVAVIAVVSGSAVGKPELQSVFADIDSRCRRLKFGLGYANVRHLRRPCLVKRTETFWQRSRSDEEAVRDPSSRGLIAMVAYDPTDGRPAPDGRPGRDASHEAPLK